MTGNKIAQELCKLIENMSLCNFLMSVNNILQKIYIDGWVFRFAWPKPYMVMTTLGNF